MRSDRLSHVYEVFWEIATLPRYERGRALADLADTDHEMADAVGRLLATGAADEPPEDELEDVRKGPYEADASPSIGRYEIIRQIDSGGMGVVYEGQEAHPRRRVAIKVLREAQASEATRERFRREADLLARLDHPCIARVYEASDAGDASAPYIAMEFVPDASTITEYADAKQLDLRQRLALFAEVCDAVQHAHQRQVIHRDLSPRNILVNAQGRPKIIDFGISILVTGETAITRQTGPNDIIGTLEYLSPEQCLGDPNAVDTGTDIYTLGVVLYELLCNGKLPYEFGRRIVQAAVRVICETEAVRPSSVNRALRGDVEAIVLKALEKDPTRRYRTAQAFGDDIRRYLDGEAVEARRASEWYKLGKFLRRNARTAAVLGFAVVLAMAGLVWGWSTSRAEAARLESLTGALSEFVVSPDKVSTARDLDHRDLDELVEGEVRHLFASGLLADGEYREASMHAERALTIFRSIRGVDHPKSLAALMVLVDALVRDRQAERAGELITATLDRLEPSDPVRLQLRHSMARVVALRGEMERADLLYVEVIGDMKSRFGEDDIRTLKAQGNYGLLLSDNGRAAEATPLLTEVTDHYRRLFGASDARTLKTVGNLAIAMKESGNLDAACELLQTQMPALRRQYGVCHPDTLRAMVNLGNTLRRLKRLDEAGSILEEAYANAVDADRTTQLVATQALANARRDLLKFDEAEPLFVATIELERSGTDLQRCNAHSNFGYFHRFVADRLEHDPPERKRRLVLAAGEFARAVASATRAVESGAVSRYHLPVVWAHHDAGSLLTHLMTVDVENRAEYASLAVPHLTYAFNGYRENHGLDDSDTQVMANGLVAVLDELGRTDEAGEYRQFIVKPADSTAPQQGP